MLLSLLAMNEYALIIALKLSRDSANRVRICSRAFSCDDALLKFELTCHLQIEPSLLHDHIKAGKVFVAEVKTRLGHVCIDHFMENLDVGRSVSNDSLDKAMVAIGTKSINYQFD